MKKKFIYIGIWSMTIISIMLIFSGVRCVSFLFLSIFLLLSIYLKKRFNPSLILFFSYFIVIFFFAVKILLSLNKAQFQLIWVEIYPLIAPFERCHMNLFHFFQSIFSEVLKIKNENISLAISWVFFPSLSFLIIGGVFYYLIGVWIDVIYHHLIIVLDRNKRTKNNLILLMKSIVFFLCFVYLLVCFKVWDKLNYKHTLFLSSYEAEKDFKNKKYRYLIWGEDSGQKRYFSGRKIGDIEIWVEPVNQKFLLPIYLDKRDYIEHYNLTMLRLLEFQTKNNFKEIE
jgi:hypothetical protein